MLKHLGKSAPRESEEVLSPEETQELLDKAKKDQIELRVDELKALKKIAMMSPDYEFEEVKLTPQENKN